MPDLEILHGPRLSPFKAPLGEKRRPCTWTLGFRAQAPMVDGIERLARQRGVGNADIMRTAVAEFLAKYEISTPDINGQPLTAHHSPREAQINQGLVPHTEKTKRQPQSSVSHLRAMQNQSTSPTNNSASKPTDQTDKRGGMKDKIPSF